MGRSGVSVSVGINVAVGGRGVSVSVGTGVGVIGVSVAVGEGFVAVNVGRGVLVLVGGDVDVHTGVAVAGLRSRVDVKVKKTVIGVKVEVGNGGRVKVKAAVAVIVTDGVAVNPVTGMSTMGEGMYSPIISMASAAAVLFILTYERSSVLRNWISSAVGGLGSRPAMMKIIQTMPKQKNSAKKACTGTANCLNLTGRALLSERYS